ncbi:MAG TPA: glutamate--tRNA ligase [Longimicrobiales bacterium]|nr:glutamate--tRNA ligase [Longimicrobiales bacterium]
MNHDDGMRLRFAPSPTGYLHVGGARTALFNWLLARRCNGVFVLRIEDTDRERSSAAMTQAILDGMTWLGLDWDEGPFHQADGIAQHRTDVRTLLEAGAAYRCFCSPAELEVRRNAHPEGPAAFRYDRRCAALDPDDAAQRAAAGEPHTVRCRVPAGTTQWSDAVYGDIAFDNADIEDFIILRSDGTPIYNMAVVSDDSAMRITHVLRGDDHVSNTPRQILLYQALGRTVPTFAHLPMILGPDGRRLSKRHGATAVGEYAERGILPDTMVNFLALLGWNPGTEQEIFTRAELIAQFSLDNVNRKSAVFDTQKLEWMNAQYIARMPAGELIDGVRVLLPGAPAHTPAWWAQLVELLRVRARTLRDMADQAHPYVYDELVYDEAAVAKHWKETATLADRFSMLRERWGELGEWDAATLESGLRTLADQQGVSAGKVIHPLRVALTGGAASPGIFDIAQLLGRERVLSRLDSALRRLRTVDRIA